MNIKVKICDKAIELIDLLANMPLADDEFVDEIIDGGSVQRAVPNRSN